jgi:hypothetical protein
VWLGESTARASVRVTRIADLPFTY